MLIGHLNKKFNYLSQLKTSEKQTLKGTTVFQIKVLFLIFRQEKRVYSGLL
jgi:hypothetical protein